MPSDVAPEVEGRNARNPGSDTSSIRGSNQSGVRAHNERVVLSLIRYHGELAKAEIARRSGLSAQTASVIIRALIADGLVVAGSPQRGRIGQPSVPMRLAQRGAFAFGLKIGRRTSEVVLTDFAGELLGHRAIQHPAPSRAAVIDFTVEATEALGSCISPAERGTIAGLGVCMPFDLWAWNGADGGSEGDEAGWKRPGLKEEVAHRTGFPVFLSNDATAACGAEHAFGRNSFADYVYFFVGAFVGGGIVIDGRLVRGRVGNAGALGSTPIRTGAGAAAQLIDAASIDVLERIVARESGAPAPDLWREGADWTRLGPALDRWIASASHGLAQAILSAVSVYDFEAAVIDGSFPPQIRERLARETDRLLGTLDHRGLERARVVEGTIGRRAREIGAASLPFFARYFLDHRVLYAERS